MTDINLFIDQALSRFDIKDEATISAIRNSFTNSDPGSLGAILETLNGKSATVVGASELILYGGTDTFYSNTSTGTNVHTGAIAEEYAALSSSRALLKNTEAYQWIRTTQTISASGKIEYAPGGGNVAISDYVKTSGLSEASGNLERAIADIYDRVISERFVMEAPSSSTVTAFNGVGDTLIVNAVELPSAVSRGFVINNVGPSIYAGMPQQVLNQTFSIEGHNIATNALGNEFTTHTLENIHDTYTAKAVDISVIGSKVDYPAEMINEYIAAKNKAADIIDFNGISDRLGSTDAATRSSALSELNDFFTKNPVGKALRGAGEALIVYDAITTGLAANRQAELGNYDLAGEMISKLASRISAGVLGAEIGALLGVSMFLAMTVEGATAGSVLGPWGIAIGALYGLAGAIALSPVGDKIGSAIWDTVRFALKNLNIDPNTAGKWLAEHNLLHPVVVDPLVIDLAGNGFELIAASASSVQMDMNGNGYAEKIGWVKGSEGLLVIDRDNNGSIVSVR